MSTFFIMEAANLFAGDDPEGKHLTLTELKLPDLEEEYQDHMPGGGPAGIEVGMGVIQKLEPTFKLNGFDPALMAQFGLESGRRQTYTAYGVIRDKGTGEAHEAKAIMEARLGRISGDAFERGNLQGHEYSLREVWRYELSFKGRKLFEWSFRRNRLVVGGVD